MVIKYVIRGYILRVTSYAVRVTKYVLCGTKYEVRLTWVSLYDFPPLSACQGRFSFRKWFCFLDLKIKNGWSFHFGYCNFSGKGNNWKYLMECYFLGYIYNKVSRCQGGDVVGWVGCGGCAVGWVS